MITLVLIILILELANLSSAIESSVSQRTEPSRIEDDEYSWLATL